MFSAPDPLIFRSLAYILAAAVVGSEKILGGTALALFATIISVMVGGYLFPANRPRNNLRKAIYGRLSRISSIRWRRRLVWAILMIAGVAFLNGYVGGDSLGLEYSFFLIAIFIASLLFGMPIAIAAWLLSFLLVYYFVVPPKSSFEIGSIKEFADLIGYFYLGLAMLAIAVLFRASSSPEKTP
ncbi:MULTISPECIES: DUF4118 domain-containing protein [Bradyrhizobium]|uniref:Sensor protein KdpD transmembrane domain-containing protein n=2 Tax=Bradyrhizobium TaxID=374 RepID=A0ABY0Q7H6_9BRAD|nr:MULTISPECIES: DUF4118 domain-containing protein [Bradyrhizobium]SDJ64756.1 protein of unknown function [Bradyrhizobium ottawaense]SEC31694.1 protein of unknown function [Bradyrhizobium lablabi]